MIRGFSVGIYMYVYNDQPSPLTKDKKKRNSKTVIISGLADLKNEMSYQEMTVKKKKIVVALVW
jgi:hypothetical protein